MQAGGNGQLIDTSAALGRTVAKQPAKELQIFLNRQRGIEIFAESLWHVGDMRTDLSAVARTGHVAAQRLHPA